MRRLNARLVLESDDRSDLEVLPVIRIAHATGEEVGLPRQDPAFIPASGFLREDATPKESFYRLRALLRGWGFAR